MVTTMMLSGWAVAACLACLTAFGAQALKFTFKCPPAMTVDASLEKTTPMDTDFKADPYLIMQAGYNFDYILYTTKLRRCGLFEDMTQQLGDLVDFGRPIKPEEADFMAYMFGLMSDGKGTAHYHFYNLSKNVTLATVDLLNKYGVHFDEHAHELYADE